MRRKKKVKSVTVVEMAVEEFENFSVSEDKEYSDALEKDFGKLSGHEESYERNR